MAEADPIEFVNVHEAKTNVSRLLERARKGEEIVIGRAGRPCAKLVPHAPVSPRRRAPGGWPDLAAIPDSVWSDPLPDDELAFREGRRLDKYGL